MRFETVYRAGLGVGGVESGPRVRRFPSAMPHLLEVDEGTYDRRVAELLTFVSTWTYSDLRTFASVMARRGLLGSDIASLTISNDPLLVNTSAVVAQSEDKNVVILSFRGTELRNSVAWLTDASARAEPFISAGRVHGGFHRAIRALWYPLTELLNELYKKTPLCEQMTRLEEQWVTTCGGTRGRRDEGTRPSSDGGGDTGDGSKLRALYITGHSFGGALAVLAAAIIQSEPELKELRGTLRGVYTFGQPMVGDPTFVKDHEMNIGKKLFRHVYGNDIVPRMPPLTVGRFAHLGRQYSSTASGWVYQSRPLRQAITFGVSNVMGLAGWIIQQATPFSLLHMPFSWGDHMPLNYVRTSMLDIPGTEFR